MIYKAGAWLIIINLYTWGIVIKSAFAVNMSCTYLHAVAFAKWHPF